MINIIRDPRDVSLSMRKLPWASKSVFANLQICSERYLKSEVDLEDGLRLSIKYENLINQTNKTLHLICSFVGENFENKMLFPGKGAEKLIGRGEWWKKQVSQPLDTSRVSVWKKELSNDYKLAVSYLSYDILKKYGYELYAQEPCKNLLLFPLSYSFLEKNEQLLIRIARERIRPKGISGFPELLDAIRNCNVDNSLVFLGRVREPNWRMGATSFDRIITIFRLFWSIIICKKKGIDIAWCRLEDDKQSTYTAKSKAERLGEIFLNKLPPFRV